MSSNLDYSLPTTYSPNGYIGTGTPSALSSYNPTSGAQNTSALSSLNQGLGEAGNAGGIYMGLEQGGVGGYGTAGVNAANLYGTVSGNQSGITPYTSGAGDILGAYNGLESGTDTGDAQAAIDLSKLGVQGASALGDIGAGTAGELEQGLGYAAIPLSLYNFANNWQSGNTGSDALNGAGTGASIGTAIVPGIGTAIGALIGGAAGALSSAFGGGKPDEETEGLNQLQGEYQQAYNQNPQAAQSALSTLSPSESYQALAGAMDAKNNTAGNAQPIEQTFGREGEQNLLTQMAGQINQAYNAGQITPGESAQDVYQNVVSPWLSSETGGQGLVAGGGGNTGLVQGQGGQAGLLGGSIENLVGDYMNGSLTGNTQIGIAGQTDPNLAPYLGLNAGPSQALIRGTGFGGTPYGGASIGAYDTSTSTPSGGAGVASYLAAKEGAGAASPTPAAVAAEGGSMKKRMHSALPHFDDGGSTDDYYDFSDGSDLGSGNIDYSLTGDPFSNVDTLDYSFGSSNPYSSTGTDFSSGFDASGADTAAMNSTGASGSSSGNWLSNLLGTSSGSGSSSSSSGIGSTLASLAKSYGWLLPLIGAATGVTNQKAPTPTTPAGMSSTPSTPYATPAYTRTQTQFPSNYNWYTYGEHPEQQFFSNNQLPTTSLSPTTAAPTTSALGSMPAPQMGGMMPQTVRAAGGTLDFAEGSGNSYVEGPGDGTSDDIPAKLSDGEYVIDAGTVSMLGNGSNQAGARRLDALRANVRKHAGRDLSRGKQFMKAKLPEQYLPPASYGPRKDQE